MLFCVYLCTYDLWFKNLLLSTLVLPHLVHVKMKTKTLMWVWVNVSYRVTFLPTMKIHKSVLLHLTLLVTRNPDNISKKQSVHVSTAAGQSNVRAGCSVGENASLQFESCHFVTGAKFRSKFSNFHGEMQRNAEKTYSRRAYLVPSINSSMQKSPCLLSCCRLKVLQISYC
jgi:hypothetical protein